MEKDTKFVKKDKYSHIIIKNKKGKKIQLVKGPKSILNSLGFDKNEYEEKISHRSKKVHNLNLVNVIYLFLENIQKKPFAVIDLNKKCEKVCPIKIKFDEPINKLEDLTIKFKTGSKSKSKLYDFGGKKHKLSFEIESEIK